MGSPTNKTRELKPQRITAESLRGDETLSSFLVVDRRKGGNILID